MKISNTFVVASNDAESIVKTAVSVNGMKLGSLKKLSYALILMRLERYIDIKQIPRYASHW